MKQILLLASNGSLSQDLSAKVALGYQDVKGGEDGGRLRKSGIGERQ